MQPIVIIIPDIPELDPSRQATMRAMFEEDARRIASQFGCDFIVGTRQEIDKKLNPLYGHEAPVYGPRLPEVVQIPPESSEALRKSADVINESDPRNRHSD
jgi:hypothetical protein